MSIIFRREQKKKGKHPRWNHKNYHIANRHKLKRRIYRRRGWKLKYPDLFKEIDDYPYIIRKSI